MLQVDSVKLYYLKIKKFQIYISNVVDLRNTKSKNEFKKKKSARRKKCALIVDLINVSRIQNEKCVTDWMTGRHLRTHAASDLVIKMRGPWALN